MVKTPFTLSMSEPERQIQRPHFQAFHPNSCMDSNSLARLKVLAGRQTVTLTHHGRNTW
jgi:hypothetical protein